METFDAEPIKISTDQILQSLRATPLPMLIATLKNTGDIEDRTLRRLWNSAKRSVEHVEKYLQGVVAERGQGPKQEQGH